MENQNNKNISIDRSSNPDFNNNLTTEVKKSYPFRAILFTFFISAIIFGFTGYYLGLQKSSSQIQISQNQLTPSISPDLQISSPALGTNLITYVSKLEKLSFHYPSDWISSPAEPDLTTLGGDTLTINDPNEKVIINWYSIVDGLGGSCDPNIPFDQLEGELGLPCPLYEIVDKQKLPNADLYYVAYVVTTDGKIYEPNFALQDFDGVLTTQRAFTYLLFTGMNNNGLSAGLLGRGLVMGTKAEAQNFYKTNEAQQAKNILMSAAY